MELISSFTFRNAFLFLFLMVGCYILEMFFFLSRFPAVNYV